MSDASKETGWVKVYHPTGILVTLPVPVPTIETESGGVVARAADYHAAFRSVSEIVEAGFTPEAPGLVAGEEKEMCGWIVRMTKSDNRGIANILHLYSTRPGWNKPFLTVYLNNADDVSLFNRISGVNIEQLAKYIGTGRLERNSGNPDWDSLIHKLPKPVGVVYGPNPKYNAADAAAADEAKKSGGSAKPYTVPKKKFIRWADAPAGTDGVTDHRGYDATREFAEWDKIFKSEPPVEVFNRQATARWENIPNAGRDAIRKKIRDYTTGRGWVWDEGNQEFIDPANKKPESVGGGEDIPF